MNYLCLGDLHLGAYSGSIFFQNIQKEFVDNFLIPLVKEKQVKTLIQVGDWYDSKKIPSTHTIKFSNYIMDELFAAGIIEIIHIDGNHDLHEKNIDGATVAVSSFDEIHGYREGITSVSSNIREDGEFVYVPYSKNSEVNFENYKGKIVFGHFDILEFKMRNGAVCEHGLNPKDMKGCKFVVSGHYHCPSNKYNIAYIGVPYELDWNDYGYNHGVYIFNDEKKKVFTPEVIPYKDHKNFFKLFFSDGKLYDFENKEIENFDIFKNKVVKLYVKDIEINSTNFSKINNVLSNLCYTVDIVDHRTIDLSKVNTSREEGKTKEEVKSVNMEDIKTEYFTNLQAQLTEDKALFDEIYSYFEHFYQQEAEKITSNIDKSKFFQLESISLKNFLSFGNVLYTHEFSKDDMVLISGTNGSGKTTLLEAIFFAYKGVSFRGINKSDLVNKVNGREAYVSLKQRIGNNEYIINRGIKPDVFEVYENGEKIPSTGAPDLQKKLDAIIVDKDILKQTIIISMMDYIPFMKLKADKRRAYLEEYFSFEVFNNMIKIVRASNSEVSNYLVAIDQEIAKLNSEIQIHEQEKIDWNTHKESNIQAFDKDIKDAQDKKSVAQTKLNSVKEEMAKFVEQTINTELEEANKSKGELQSKVYKIEAKKTEIGKVIKFLETNSVCPVGLACNQISDPAIKEEKLKDYRDKVKKLEEAKPVVAKAINKIDAEIISKLNEKKNELNGYKAHTYTLDNEIKIHDGAIARIEANKKKFMESMDNKEQSIDSEILQKKTLIENNEGNKSQNQRLSLVYNYLINILDEKKDGNIKQLIVNKWIEYIEVETNKYLEIMSAGFYVKFDNNLEITANPYNKKYEALSAGERQRFDLSLLFVFNEISRMKNIGVNSNIIFFDEILDSSLDMNAISGLIAIFKMMIGRNKTCYVISHRDEVKSMFNKILNFQKKDKFTHIEATGF